MKTLGAITVMMFVLLQCAIAAPPHGFTHAAINSLHRAEETMDPKDLQSAKRSLERAIEVNKESDKPMASGLGLRNAAHAEIIQALKALEKKDHIAAAKCIKQAIKLAEGATHMKPK